MRTIIKTKWGKYMCSKKNGYIIWKFTKQQKKIWIRSFKKKENFIRYIKELEKKLIKSNIDYEALAYFIWLKNI